MLQDSSLELIKDKKHFDAWRSQGPNRRAVPEWLWKLAVSHIPRYGLNRVSREFRLNYTKLKEKARQVSLACPDGTSLFSYRTASSVTAAD